MTKLAFVNGSGAGAAAPSAAHKLRAFLTVLGVIIGTGTIIGVGAILTGFDASITGVLRSFGPNSIIVFKFPVGPRTGNLSPEERTRKDLTYQNAVDIRERCKAVQDVSPMMFPNEIVNVHYKGNDMYDVNLMGVEEAYARGGPGGHAPGALLHRRREPPPHAGGRGRRGHREGALRQRRPDRQDHQRGWPRVPGDRHHAAPGRVLLRRHR